MKIYQLGFDLKQTTPKSSRLLQLFIYNRILKGGNFKLLEEFFLAGLIYRWGEVLIN